MEYVTLVPSSLSVEQHNATYSCSLTNTWSKETHPVLYETIESSAHWSSPVLVTHNKNFDLWEPGSLASPGVENVAEKGYTGPIYTEILAAQDSGFASGIEIGMDQSNALGRPQTFRDISLTPEFPVLSTLTMMTPSPDWFTGISSFSPIHSLYGVWYDFFEVATYPCDAGTKKGYAYNGLGSLVEVPHKPISQLTIDTVPKNGVLLNPSRTTVLPVALWSCSLQKSNTGHCKHYFEKCTDSSPCCWGSCVDGICKKQKRESEREKRASRESFKLNNYDRGFTGAAIKRDPRTDSISDVIDEYWLRGSGD